MGGTRFEGWGGGEFSKKIVRWGGTPMTSYYGKPCSDQLSIANSNNPSVVNFICIRSFRHTHVITSRKFQFKINVVTDKGSSQNEIRHRTNDQTEVALQSWL